MPDRDAHLDVGHPEAAGWVLGALDPEEAERFKGHLESCTECRAAVAELEPVTRLLKTAAPAARSSAEEDLPADLQARTFASLERAAKKAVCRRRSIRRRWPLP